MVFYINKQAVEIKSRFENAPLTSINECCCVVGILAKIYGLQLPRKFDTIDEMKNDIHRQIDDKRSPSEYATKILFLLDQYYKLDTITEELYGLLKYSYDEQIGTEPAYK
jgi:hypothetical protein